MSLHQFSVEFSSTLWYDISVTINKVNVLINPLIHKYSGKRFKSIAYNWYRI